MNGSISAFTIFDCKLDCLKPLIYMVLMIVKVHFKLCAIKVEDM